MDIRVAWTPSASEDVVVQKLNWLVNGVIVDDVNLQADINTRLASQDGVNFTEGDVVGVVIVVNDGKSDSTPVSGEVQIPLDPPQPITNLTIELVE